MKACIVAIISLSVILGSTAYQCGLQAGGGLCPDGLCCSRFGWCGATDEYCKEDCQSQCGGVPPPVPPSGVPPPVPPSGVPPPVPPSGVPPPVPPSGVPPPVPPSGVPPPVPPSGVPPPVPPSGVPPPVPPSGVPPPVPPSGVPPPVPPSGVPPPVPPSGVPPPVPLSGVASIISADQFNQMLRHRDDYSCAARGFYTYDAFIAAANSFDGFGTTGNTVTRKREIAAFLGQTSHETTGGGPAAPDGPYSWGYCFKEEQGNPSDYCSFSFRWPCKPGKKYYGRGPMQLSYNYNYGAAGRAIGEDLLADPDLVASDPIVSFKTAIWYWMTPEFLQKPSCHDVITGHWFPLPTDIVAGRYAGYGTITNIINGGSECGHGEDGRVNDRIGFYERYYEILGVDPGPHLDCNHQWAFQPKLLSAISF